MFDKDFLIELRISKNLTQKQLAKKLGVHRNQINRWECGKCTPDFTSIEKLATFFKVNISDFLK